MKILANVRLFGSLIRDCLRILPPENLFLHEQLALYSNGTRNPGAQTMRPAPTPFALSRLVDWRPVLVIGEPDTLIRWHRQGV